MDPSSLRPQNDRQIARSIQLAEVVRVVHVKRRDVTPPTLRLLCAVTAGDQDCVFTDKTTNFIHVRLHLCIKLVASSAGLSAGVIRVF